MESISIFEEPFDRFLNKLVESPILRIRTIILVKKDPDWISNYFNGKVSGETVCALIMKSRKSYLLRRLMPLVLDCIQSQSITEDVFSAILKYDHPVVRERMIISLAHKSLPYEMIKTLCQTDVCFEPFFELVCQTYTDSAFTKCDFRKAVNYFMESPFHEMLPDLYQELQELESSDSQKIEELKRMVIRRMDNPEG